MSADLYFTSVSFFFFLSFFLSFFFLPSNLRGHWTELKENWPPHTVWSKRNLKTHVRHLEYPLSLQIRSPKTTFFGWLCNLTAILTAYIFGMKHDIDNRSSALTTTRGLLHRPKISWTLVHKRLQTRSAFLPTLRKFSILLHCQASQMDINKWNSTKLCQVMGSKSP